MGFLLHCDSPAFQSEQAVVINAIYENLISQEARNTSNFRNDQGA